MQIVRQEAQIVTSTPNPISVIVYGARTCYQSHGKVDGLPHFEQQQENEALIRRLIKSGHYSVLEHASFTARVITDRATTHEIVRHRLCAFSQESTRYCRYCGSSITLVWPVLFGPMPEGFPYCNHIDPIQEVWWESCLKADMAYGRMIMDGAPPQLARKVLPQSLKAELVISANIREWRHIFKLRVSKAADPQIRALMTDLYIEAKRLWPVLFEDLELDLWHG